MFLVGGKWGGAVSRVAGAVLAAAVAAAATLLYLAVMACIAESMERVAPGVVTEPPWSSLAALLILLPLLILLALLAVIIIEAVGEDLPL